MRQVIGQAEGQGRSEEDKEGGVVSDLPIINIFSPKLLASGGGGGAQMAKKIFWM